MSPAWKLRTVNNSPFCPFRAGIRALVLLFGKFFSFSFYYFHTANIYLRVRCRACKLKSVNKTPLTMNHGVSPSLPLPFIIKR